MKGSSMHSDYEYGRPSGYQHSSGDYYDPNTNLFWLASTQKWYFYNEETNTYGEVRKGVDASESTDEKPSGILMEELAKIYRQVAKALQPGEMINRALKRLKEKASSDPGASSGPKNKDPFN
ncbi:hypothetical protein OROHE_006049 [Orobanche hederae]